MPTPTKARTRKAPPELPDLDLLVDDFVSHLEGANRSPNTVSSYVNCANALVRFLRAEKLPTSASLITAKHIDAFMADLQTRVASATAAKHYRSIQQLFKFLERDEPDFTSPMTKMSPPKIDEKPVPVIPVDHAQKILDTCKGNTFENRRDTAMLKFMYDTGLRVGELVGMDLVDYDQKTKTVTVTGKGNKTRALNCGTTTIDAIRRYLRYRAVHPFAELTDAFWLGRKGRLTVSGVAQMLDRRAAEADVPHLHPHQFRHTFAHNWLDGGGNEGDLMNLAGWSSREMIGRYGKSAAGTRARGAHARLSPADRLLK